MGNIFVVGACTVDKVASFVGKIFVVRPPTTITTNILPHENYPLYGIPILLSESITWRATNEVLSGWLAN